MHCIKYIVRILQAKNVICCFSILLYKYSFFGLYQMDSQTNHAKFGAVVYIDLKTLNLNRLMHQDSFRLSCINIDSA